MSYIYGAAANASKRQMGFNSAFKGLRKKWPLLRYYHSESSKSFGSEVNIFSYALIFRRLSAGKFFSGELTLLCISTTLP
jgi:hypothetical protein